MKNYKKVVMDIINELKEDIESAEMAGTEESHEQQMDLEDRLESMYDCYDNISDRHNKFYKEGKITLSSFYSNFNCLIDNKLIKFN